MKTPVPFNELLFFLFLVHAQIRCVKKLHLKYKGFARVSLSPAFFSILNRTCCAYKIPFCFFFFCFNLQLIFREDNFTVVEPNKVQLTLPILGAGRIFLASQHNDIRDAIVFLVRHLQFFIRCHNSCTPLTWNLV